jgi:hypothetical protein
LDHEEFYAELINDEEIIDQLDILKPHLNEEQFLYKLRMLCRYVYLAQYNADTFRLEDGFGAKISESRIEEVASQFNGIIDYISSYKPHDVYEELLVIVKKYYIETATPEEKDLRMGMVPPKENDDRFGFRGTFVNFNEIDWEYFNKIIEPKIKD